MLLSQGCQAGENNISVAKMKQFLNEQTRAIERRAGLLSVTENVLIMMVQNSRHFSRELAWRPKIGHFPECGMGLPQFIVHFNKIGRQINTKSVAQIEISQGYHFSKI